MTKIFFDVDGVLVYGLHSKPKFRKAWNETIFEDLGIKGDDLKQYVSNSTWSDIMEGKKDLKDFLKDVLPKLNFKGTPEDIMDFMLDKNSKTDEKLIKILYSIKQKYKDVELYAATNQEHYRADYLWNNLELKNIFKDIFYSAKMGITKDNPDFFYKINEQLNFTNCKDVLFFDDSPKNVESAKLAGWNAFEYETIKDFIENPLIKSLL